MQLPDEDVMRDSHSNILASAAAGTRGGGTVPSSPLGQYLIMYLNGSKIPNKPIKTILVASGQEDSLLRTRGPSS